MSTVVDYITKKPQLFCNCLGSGCKIDNFKGAGVACEIICDCILENRPCCHTEIHFLPVDESHTHALSRDTKHLSLDGLVCFCRWLFSDVAKPQGYISWPVWPLRGINKTAWGAKLILTADLGHSPFNI